MVNAPALVTFASNRAVRSVALDATLWDEPTTGIGLYTRELASALLAQGVTVERLGAQRSGERPRRMQSRTAWALAELPDVLLASTAQLFHAVNNFNLPLRRMPGKRMVLTVHDVIPDLFPRTVSVPYRWQFRLWLTRSLKVADRVICVSRCTRADLLRRFEVDAERVHVVPNGVDHLDRLPPLDATSARYLDSLALPEAFVLYAGSLAARKNVGLVLDALVELRRRGRNVPLVLAGQSWFGSGEVERRIGRLRADGFDLRPLGYLEPALFYAVMRRATVFVFPSLYEGFGLPPLEAMKLGVPCVVSNAGSLPEVVGDAAVQVPPDDALRFAREVERLWTQKEARAQLSEAGRKRAAGFTWAKTAERTIAVYREALR